MHPFPATIALTLALTLPATAGGLAPAGSMIPAPRPEVRGQTFALCPPHTPPLLCNVTPGDGPAPRRTATPGPRPAPPPEPPPAPSPPPAPPEAPQPDTKPVPDPEAPQPCPRNGC